MSIGEFEHAGFGEAGRRMDVATHNARVAERQHHSSAQDWRDSRWSALDCYLDDQEVAQEAQFCKCGILIADRCWVCGGCDCLDNQGDCGGAGCDDEAVQR